MWLVVLILIILAIAGWPTWPYAAHWGFGYYPSGGLILLAVILALVFLWR